MAKKSEKAEGKLKRIAIALKPLKFPFMAMLFIWALSGIAAVLFFTQWVYVTILLILIVIGIAMVIDYQAEKEKRGKH